MLAAALGCNLAWGLVDAVMYLVRTITDRGSADARSLSAGGPTPKRGAHHQRCPLKGGRRDCHRHGSRGHSWPDRRLASVPERPTLKADDLLAALAVFLLVVASTFPVALPFVLIKDAGLEFAFSRHRAGDVVSGGPCPRPLCRLWHLEGRIHDGGDWRRACGSGHSARRMTCHALHLFAVLATFTAHGTAAEEVPAAGAHRFPPASWEFGISAYPTFVRDGENYTSAIAVADRGRCISKRDTTTSRSVRVQLLSDGLFPVEKHHVGVDSAAGGVWGTTRGFVPGARGAPSPGSSSTSTPRSSTSVTARTKHSYLYAWSELGFRPFEWLRIGIAGQRTRLYGGDRDIQRGPFAQLTWQRVTVGGYWFNPGSSDQLVVSMSTCRLSLS